MTPKQRAKVYLEAAKYFANKKKLGGKSGFCDYVEMDLNCFPEYKLFSPEYTTPFTYWFPTYNRLIEGDSVVDQRERITALLFCELMAKDV